MVAEERGPLRTMADPFTGSGVVARLGRLLGLEVHAADIEEYARPFGTAFLTVSPDDIEPLFAPWGGYAAVLTHLNSLRAPEQPEDEYFARHYAPTCTETADADTERMFFTRENALRIDAMLAAIDREELGPGGTSAGGEDRHNEHTNGRTGAQDAAHDAARRGEGDAGHDAARTLRRDILLSGVLVEMSVHNNTSGVMKGFHHGWGGRGGDALGRIMAPVELEPLPFIAGPRGSIRIGDASLLTEAPDGRPFDVAYLDPPYNIHQYGANYHLLTSAVRRDFYDPGPVERGRRAGIRTDHYRSEYCRRSGKRAYAAMADVLGNLRARNVLVSYNNDGIVRPDEMLELLSEDGRNRVHLLSRQYQKFRGGKATQGAVRTREYLFVVYRGVSQSGNERKALQAEIAGLAAERDLHNRFLIPQRWQSLGGSAVRRPSGGWHLTDAEGVDVELDRELRVRRVALAEAGEAVAPGRDRIEAATAAPWEAAEAMIEVGEWDTAMRLLKRMKITAYRDHFQRLTERLAEQSLPEPVKRRLEELRARVLAGRSGSRRSGSGRPGTDGE